MRLLYVDQNGDFSLTDDLIDDIPPYAILSHTWGEDHEEVSLKDLTINPRRAISGYKKLRFCAEQAARDSLEHFWVDTCCIDKTNSVELQEAIVSMFCWYQNAVKCYVYLSDVSITKRKASDQSSEFTWEPAFRASRWFSRGWTLQELLAPRSVEFFSRERKRLGNKRTLERQIHDSTGIAVSALRGTPLSEFSVEERMLWAEKRQTKRREDKAYSLMGIFEIHMPLIYGEGAESALSRLQQKIHQRIRPAHYHDLLNHLPYAVEAPFNSYANRHELVCLSDTRVDLLREIYNWADGEDVRPIFWLSGLAGTGKSTISRTVARHYLGKQRLGASFFFSRGGGDVSHAGKFVTSIAVQLATSLPALRQYIINAIKKHSNIASRSLRDQWHELVLGPISKLDGNDCQSLYVLVIDALDECDNEDDIRIILYLLAEVRSLGSVQLHVFLTSRPEIPIRHGFCQIPNQEHQDFVLHNIPQSIIDHDITIFLQYKLNIISRARSLDASWPGEEILRYLVQAASGLFIWAATASSFLQDGPFVEERVHLILETSMSSTAPEEHLNKLYTTVLQKAIRPTYTAPEIEVFKGRLQLILGSVVTLFSPLSMTSLSRLLNIKKQMIDQLLKDLHAILDIPKAEIYPLRLHHPSFRDFLLSKDRCNNLDFYVDEKQAHQILAESCIQLMSPFLKQDICRLNAPGALTADMDNSRIEQFLPPDVQYSCLYWIQHLQKSGAQLQDNDKVHQFLRKHLLHWLEALGWIGKTSEGILAIISLQNQISADKSPNLHAFIYDAMRFALYNRSVIEQVPLQLYCSALVFAPEKSFVRRQFEEYIPSWIQRKLKVQAYWNAALQTLEGHSAPVSSVAFSPNGKQVVSGSIDKMVRLWDAVTGAPLQTLEGHSDRVSSVAFSSDGKQIVSGSDDKTVRLWDAVTGAPLQTLKGHSDRINSVVFSPDGKQVVSGSDDKMVRVWDAATGAPLQTLEGHSSYVYSVAFSPDGKQAVSGSLDKTVRLWNAATGASLQTLEGHSYWVSSVAFSPNGKQVVSGSGDKTVRLWDAATGAPLQTLEGHSSYVYSVAFSPDGKQIVSGSNNNIVRLWDAVTGAPLQTLEGHSSAVYSVAFSPDGKQIVSGSNDKTVRLWDAVMGAPLQMLEGHSDRINSVVFSPDGKQVVSGSEDTTIRLWDAATGAPLQTLEGHSSYVGSVVFSPDGKQLVSRSGDKTVRLWDAVTGAPLQTLEGHSDQVSSVAFSPNGKQVVSGSGDKTVRLWDAVTGAPLQTLGGHSDRVSSVAFSPNGKQVVSGSGDKTVRLWDAITGAPLQTLEGHSDLICSVVISPNGKQVVSGSRDKTVRLWDAVTGAPLQTLKAHSDWVWSVAFSPDGKQIISASQEDKMLQFWDAVTGAPLQTLEGHADWIDSMVFSPDGKLLPTLHISNNNSWIAEGITNILWLPPEYRSACEAIWNEFVVLAHSSGRMSFYKFTQGPKRLT